MAVSTASAIKTIRARRTLVVGLGSTGAMACNQILERLTWMYGSPDNIPWVKFVVIETAPVRVPRVDNVNIPIQINQNDFASLIANPAMFKETMDLPSWFMAQVARRAGMILAGAANTRHLGRIALLYPYNCAQVMNAIHSAIGELQSSLLDNSVATNAFHNAGMRSYNVILSSNVYVYVVGSACGGTASGSFVDMGYLIQSITGTAINTTGMFLLPATDHPDEQHKANAYAALVELNHFSDDRNIYEAVFNGNRYNPLAPRLPYNNQYLLQSRSSNSVDYAKLVTAVADYIYHSILGPFADFRDAERVNVETLLHYRDYSNAMQPYFTFHISTIEFPFARVAKGCALQLTLKGLEKLVGGKELTPEQYNLIKQKIPLARPDNLIQQLLQRSQGHVVNGVKAVLDNAYKNAPNDPQVLDVIMSQLEAGFQSDSEPTAPSPFSAGCVPETINNNRDRLSQELQDTFREVMEGFFRHERYSGITYLRSFLQQLIDDMEKILNAQKKVALDAFKQEMIHSRDAVEECQRDFFLGVTLNKQRAVKRYVGEFVDNANLYYAKKADDAAREEALKIYKQFIHVLKRYQQRVDNQQCGVLTRLQTIRRSLENHYEAKVDVAVNLTATDGWVRTVNGWELFTKGETIINEYKESIDALITSESFQGSRDQMEDELARRVMNDIYTQEIKSHLLVPAQQTSRFDEHSVHVEKSELDDAEIDDIIDFARNLMHNSISQKSVVDRLMQHPQGPSLLQSLLGNNSDSDYFLDWNPGGLAKSDIHKKYKALFFNQSSTDVNAFKQWARRHGISLPPDKDMEDSNQIVLMREMGAFSMGTIRPLQEHGHNTWERFYNREEHQSRGDLRDWLSWKAKDEESLEAIQALFLLGIAIGLIESPQAKQYVVKLQKTRPSDPDEVKLSNDLEEVARKLKRAEAYIAKQIRDWWSEKESPEAFIDAYEKFVNNCDKMFLRGKQELPQRDIEILTTKYIFNHRALEEAYTERYGNLGKFALDKRDERYWCPECHKDLGPNINSLFAYNPATGIRERKCPYCSKVFD